jgi:hypothetical protein
VEGLQRPELSGVDQLDPGGLQGPIDSPQHLLPEATPEALSAMHGDTNLLAATTTRRGTCLSTSFYASLSHRSHGKLTKMRPPGPAWLALNSSPKAKTPAVPRAAIYQYFFSWYLASVFHGVWIEDDPG